MGALLLTLIFGLTQDARTTVTKFSDIRKCNPHFSDHQRKVQK